MCQIHNSGNQKYRESRPIVGSIIQSFTPKITECGVLLQSLHMMSIAQYCTDTDKISLVMMQGQRSWYCIHNSLPKWIMKGNCKYWITWLINIIMYWKYKFKIWTWKVNERRTLSLLLNTSFRNEWEAILTLAYKNCSPSSLKL